MKTLSDYYRATKFVRNLGAAALVGASMAMPAPVTAGVINTIKGRVDSIYRQVRSIRGQIGEVVKGMNETKDTFRSGGARQMSTTAKLDFGIPRGIPRAIRGVQWYR